MPELQPQYSPVKGFGALSPKGEWKFTKTGWVKTAIAPAPVPTKVQEETPAGTLPPLSTVTETEAAGSLGNLRTALRSALTEASQTTARNRMESLSGLVSGGAAPSVINAAIGLAQSGLRQTQADVFSDIMSTYKDQTQARQKELDSINELRLQFGTAIPRSVTSLSEALDYATPLVDEERRLQIAKMKKDLEGAKAKLTLTDDEWFKLISNQQARISDIDDPDQQARLFRMISESIPEPDNKDWVKRALEKARQENPEWTPEQHRSDLRALGVSEDILAEVLKTKTTTAPGITVPSSVARSTPAIIIPSKKVEKFVDETEEEKKNSALLFQPFDFNSIF